MISIYVASIHISIENVVLGKNYRSSAVRQHLICYSKFCKLVIL